MFKHGAVVVFGNRKSGRKSKKARVTKYTEVSFCRKRNFHSIGNRMENIFGARRENRDTRKMNAAYIKYDVLTAL